MTHEQHHEAFDISSSDDKILSSFMNCVDMVFFGSLYFAASPLLGWPLNMKNI